MKLLPKLNPKEQNEVHFYLLLLDSSCLTGRAAQEKEVLILKGLKKNFLLDQSQKLDE